MDIESVPLFCACLHVFLLYLNIILLVLLCMWCIQWNDSSLPFTYSCLEMFATTAIVWLKETVRKFIHSINKTLLHSFMNSSFIQPFCISVHTTGHWLFFFWCLDQCCVRLSGLKIQIFFCSSVVSALNKAWCVNCFACSTCNTKLTLK